jgi:phytoene synthase
MNIQEHLQACEKMISVGSTTFYQAFASLPSPRREAVYVIYSFCRLIDDAVDEPEQSPFTLQELRQQFDDLERAEGHFIWPALRWLFERFPLSKAPFFKQMEGQERDFTVTIYDTLEQFEEYCYLVAGTVGEMLLPVLHDAPDERVQTAGIYLGKAMQIVNIIRDVGEDQRRGRRYLPLEIMQRFGYSEDDFQQQRISPAFKQMIDELARLASQWFERGLDQLETYPLNSSFCIQLAATGYHAILDVVRMHDYDVFAKRAIVSDHQKRQIVQRLLKEWTEKSQAIQEGSEVS